MELELKDKIALITGGSEGIGRATALKLAGEGVKVAICARREGPLALTAKQISDKGGDVIIMAGDVRKAEDIERFVEEAYKKWGRIDILINNAGTAATGSFEKNTDETWQNDLDLKLFGAIRSCRLVIPYMREAGGGRIINILSITAKTPPGGSTPTSVSRAAGLALTKALSRELASANILVNAILVGLVKSGQQAQRWEAEKKEATLEEYYQRIAREAGIPLGYVAEPEEMADLITFLCSARASYITGTALNFDGGLSTTV